MKMHRVVMYVLDLNQDHTEQLLRDNILSTRWPEFKSIGEIKTVDVGEWTDEHPLNHGADEETYFKE
jgi:hypothetical protein